MTGARDDASRLTFVVSTLGPGGAERAVLRLSELLAGAGYETTVLTVSERVPDFYEVPDSVRRQRANPKADRDCRWFDIICQRRRRHALRESILNTDPDIVISSIDTMNVSVLWSLDGVSVPVIAWEHNDLRQLDIGWRWELLRRYWYRHADSVIVLDPEVASWARSTHPGWPVVDIPYPLTAPDVPKVPRPSWFARQNLIAMGQLAPQKGFDLLMPAFAQVAMSHVDWDLTILGEGSKRDALAEQARTLGLEGRVHMPGTINPPFGVLAHGDVFVMSSRYEGQPMALAEAMACGLPAISFDCQTGPRRMIRDGVDGLLVEPEDVDALADAMRRLMQHDGLRTELASRAPEIIDRFHPHRILPQWEQLLKSVGSTASST